LGERKPFSSGGKEPSPCALWNGETYTAAPLAISLNGQSGTVIIKS